MTPAQGTAREVAAEFFGSLGMPLDCPRCADAILAALSAAGYAVVPVDPTPEMITAGNPWQEHSQIHWDTRVYTEATYRAMIQAAQEAK